MILTDRLITDPVSDHPKERSLNQQNILSHLAKSDGNIRILIAQLHMKWEFIVKGLKS